MNVLSLISGLLLIAGHGMTAAEYFHSRFRPGLTLTPLPVHVADSAESTALPQASSGFNLSKEQKTVLRGIKKRYPK